MISSKSSIASAVVLALQSGLLLAQQGESRVEEVVVTPNRIAVPLRQIGTSVAILTQQDIAAHGNLALLDVLRQLPSVATSSNGGMGQPAGLRIRGEEGFRTLAIIDGIRLSDPANTQVAPLFEHLLSSNIERVEVLRGPQGLGYGADAGGVVSLMTRQGSAALQAAVDAQRGSFGTQQIGVNAGGGIAAADFFVSATQATTDGFNIRTSDTLLRDDDGYDNDTVHARVGIALAPAWRAELVHRRVAADSMFDDCGFGVVEHDCTATHDMTASRAALIRNSEHSSHTLSYAETTTDRDSLAGGVSTFATQSELQRWEYVGSINDDGAVTLVFGGDHEQATMPERTRGNHGFFVEVLGNLSAAWYVTAGIRHDDNDDFGTNTSYRVSSAYLVDVAGGVLKFKGSAGTGFRAPSLYEIAYNRGPWSSPPASTTDLQQESSRGVEAGIEFTAANGARLEAVYFNQVVDDAIIFDLNAYSGYLQELGQSDSDGIELAAALPLGERLSLQANYTWNPTKRPDGSQRLRRPRQLANIGVQWQLQPTVNLNAFVRASRNSVDQPFGAGVVALDDFAVLDVSVAWQLSDGWQLSGRIENALDAQYQEVIGYRAAPLAGYVGIRKQFKL